MPTPDPVQLSVVDEWNLATESGDDTMNGRIHSPIVVSDTYTVFVMPWRSGNLRQAVVGMSHSGDAITGVDIVRWITDETRLTEAVPRLERVFVFPASSQIVLTGRSRGDNQGDFKFYYSVFGYGAGISGPTTTVVEDSFGRIEKASALATSGGSGIGYKILLRDPSTGLAWGDGAEKKIYFLSMPGGAEDGPYRADEFFPGTGGAERMSVSHLARTGAPGVYAYFTFGDVDPGQEHWEGDLSASGLPSLALGPGTDDLGELMFSPNSGDFLVQSGGTRTEAASGGPVGASSIDLDPEGFNDNYFAPFWDGEVWRLSSEGTESVILRQTNTAGRLAWSHPNVVSPADTVGTYFLGVSGSGADTNLQLLRYVPGEPPPELPPEPPPIPSSGGGTLWHAGW